MLQPRLNQITVIAQGSIGRENNSFTQSLKVFIVWINVALGKPK